MVTVLLIRKIVELFLIMLLGYAIVKSKIIQAKESSVLSKLSLYLVVPCVIINSFQIEFTENVKKWLITGFFCCCGNSFFVDSNGLSCRKIFSCR